MFESLLIGNRYCYLIVFQDFDGCIYTMYRGLEKPFLNKEFLQSAAYDYESFKERLKSQNWHETEIEVEI